MGLCQSLYDEDELRAKELNKQYAKELHHFQQQLRASKCHSELDLNGKGKSRKDPPTAEQIQVASNILYDA
jgi:hypothetical protein